MCERGQVMGALRFETRIARTLITVSALITLAILASLLKVQPAMAAGTDLVPAASGDTVTVEVSGVYGQTEARSMLDMVNDFRTGREIDGGQTAVWALDASSPKDSILGNGGIVNTADYVGLGELTYDYELEKTAMQRAMEMLLNFSHTRPDGTKCYTAFPSGYTARGENIAAGYNQMSTAREAFDGWCETYCPYDYNANNESQGHRRNMLSRSFNRIGIASVSATFKQGNRQYSLHYWVQEFGYRTDDFGTTQTIASDGAASASIDVLRDNIESLGVSNETTSLSLTYGEANELNGLATTMRLTDTWPQGYRATVVDDYTLTSSDSSIASVSGKTITANKVGTTTVTATSALDSSATAEVVVTVEPRSLSEATVELPAGDYTYTGAVQTPVPVVTLDGTTLSADTDYTVAYDGNVSAGTATVTVTGEGNYKDSASTTFEIGRKDIAADDVSVDEIAPVTYNGETQTPVVVVKRGDATLAADTDYSVAYSKNIDAGAAVVTITGTGNYSGERTANFTIDSAPINESMVELSQESFEYSGGVQVPGVTVKANPEASGDDAATLEEGKDYTVATDGNAINCGTYEVTVTGKGNYGGVVARQYTIVQKPIDASMIQLDADSKTYNGQTQAPAVKVMNGDVELTEADCTITNDGGVNAGTYEVKVVAVDGSNYTGEASKSFSISAKDISDDDIEVVEQAAEFTGSAITPVAQVKFGEVELGSADITITCDQPCVNADTYTIAISGQGNFTGTREAHFTVNPKQLTEEMVRLDVSSFVFNGSVQAPNVTVADGDNLLANDDFEMAIDQAVNSGTYNVKVTGKRNYAGEITKPFGVTPKSLTEEMVTLDCSSFEYSGSAQAPQVTVSDGDTLTAEDYSIAVDDAVNRGTYNVKVTAARNYTGEVVKTFDITPKQLSDDMVILDSAESKYNGLLQAPVVKVMNGDVELTIADCTITNDGSLDVGTYDVMVVAVDGGNYTGGANATFVIKKALLTATYVGETIEWDGTPEYKVELAGFVNGETAETADDFEMPVVNPVDPLEPGEYDLAPQNGSARNYDFEYVGGKLTINQKPQWVVVAEQLNALSDLATATELSPEQRESIEAAREAYNALSEDEKSKVGDAVDNLEKAEEHAKSFDISNASIEAVGAQAYTGAAITPSPAIKLDGKTLSKGADYTLSYANNVNAGTATIAVKGAGNYTGSKSVTFKINKASIAKAKFAKIKAQKLKKKGKAVKPKVKVTFNGKQLKANVDYTVKYKKNKKKGKAQAIITGKGNFAGKKTIKFKIK